MLRTKYYSASQVKKNELGRACGMGGRRDAIRKKCRGDYCHGTLAIIWCRVFFLANLLSKNLKIHRTIILPVVLYGCETWLLILRDECRLREYENRVLRRICGPKRKEVTGEWRKLQNEELTALYSSPNIIWLIKSRRMRWVGHVACMEARRGAHRVLVGKHYGNRPLERPRHRWENNIKMNLQEV